MEKRACALLLVLVLLTAAAIAVLVAEERAARHREARAGEFQRLVGGLGVGPATDLSVCASAVDPRLEGRCSLGYGPVPGGACFCPWHAGAALSSPPAAGEGGDASLP